MHDVCRCRNPVRDNKVIEHMYSARPTLLTDTLTHVKLSPGEGTQREGNASALTQWRGATLKLRLLPIGSVSAGLWIIINFLNFPLP